MSDAQIIMVSGLVGVVFQYPEIFTVNKFGKFSILVRRDQIEKASPGATEDLYKISAKSEWVRATSYSAPPLKLDSFLSEEAWLHEVALANSLNRAPRVHGVIVELERISVSSKWVPDFEKLNLLALRGVTIETIDYGGGYTNRR